MVQFLPEQFMQILTLSETAATGEIAECSPSGSRVQVYDSLIVPA